MAINSDTLNPEEKVRFWKNHINAAKKSDLSQSEYCRKNKLRPNRFWYWRKRIEKSSEKEISFLPLNIPLIDRVAQVTSITTPNGYRIELADGFDPTIVRQLIHTIRDM